MSSSRLSSLGALLVLPTLVACMGAESSTEAPPAYAVVTPPPEPTPPAEDEAAPAAADSPADAKATASEESRAELAVAAPGKPGPAYFAVNMRGVVMLDGGRFTPVRGAPFEGVREIVPTPDGRVHLLGSQGVMRLDGAKAEIVAPSDWGTSAGSLVDFAVTPDGRIWGVSSKAVSVWDGAAWTTETREALGSKDLRLREVAVDGRGRVWVTSTRALHLREEGVWTTVDTSAVVSRASYFDTVATGPQGVVHGVASTRVLSLAEADRIETVHEGERLRVLGKLAFSADGFAALTSGFDGVTGLAPDGTTTDYRAGRDFEANRIRDVTPDDAGRVWVATDAGVFILGPGAERVAWAAGSVEPLAGRLDVIAVVGAGPELPADIGPVKTGRLAGAVSRDERPVVGARVELCPQPNEYFGESPCAKAPVSLSATTDDTGRFGVEDVPLGIYGAAVESGGKWHVFTDVPFGVGMEAGKQWHDIGTLVIGR